MVLRVDRVNRHEGETAPVLAAIHGGIAGALGLRQCFGSKFRGDTMCMDGDQADRLFARQRAQPFTHARGRQAEAAKPDQINSDEVTVLCLAFGPWWNVQFAWLAFFGDGHQTASAALGTAKYSKDLCA